MLRLAVRIYGSVLALYPRRFRADWGALMLDAFEQRAAEAVVQSGIPGLISWCLRAGADLARSIPAEWMEASQEDSGKEEWGMTTRRRSSTREAARDLGRETGSALRRYARAPAWSAAALTTLVVAVGAVTGVTALAWESLVRPLPFDRPEELVEITAVPDDGTGARRRYSLGLLETWQDERPGEIPVGGFASTLTPIDLGQGPEYVQGGIATGTLMNLLGVRPLIGRVFTEGDGREGAPRVVVLTEGLWRSHFGADPQVVGRILEHGSEKATVVGVVANELNALVPDARLWLSTSTFPRAPYFALFRAVGRLPQGLPLGTAGERLAGARVTGADGRAFSGSAQPLRDALVGDVRRVLIVFVGVVAGLMLVAAVNLANLFLGRAVSHEGDRRIRRALGASRRHLVRSAVVDGLVLGGVGGLGGLLVGSWIRSIVATASPSPIPLAGIGSSSGLQISVALPLAVGLCTGLVGWTTWAAARRESVRGLASRGGSASRAARRAQRALTVLQVAAAFVLLTGSTLLVRTFVHLSSLDAGFDIDPVGSLELSLDVERYPDAAAQEAFARRLVAELTTLPGVASATAVDRLLVRTRVHGAIHVAGADSLASSGTSVVIQAQPGFLQTMGIPLLRGRALDAAGAAEGPPVALVSETFGRTFFPGSDPLGRRFRWGDGEWRTIVGIVEDVRTAGPAGEIEPLAIASIEQTGSWTNFVSVAFRAPGGAERVLGAVRARLRELDPRAPIVELGTYERWIGESPGYAEARFRALVVGLLGAVASLLAMVGVYGVTAHGVRLRTRELGIRLALGEGSRGIFGLVLREGLRLAAAGVLLGGAVGWVAVQAVEDLLIGQSARDPLHFAAVGGALTLVALAACARPALSASRVAPVEALAEG